MAKKKETEELSRIVADLPKMIDALDKKIVAIVTRMDELKKAGLVYATEHWRRDNSGVPKYFYLLYPQQPGEKRRREYIGTDAAKIHAAQEGRQRAHEYDDLARDLRHLRGYVMRVSQDLGDAKRHLKTAIT